MSDATETPVADMDDLWTSDAAPTQEPSPPPEPTESPEPPVAVIAAEPEPEPAVAAERDEAGKFTGKKAGKPRSDPQARVQQATAETARLRAEAQQAKEETQRLRAELDASRRPAPPAEASRSQSGAPLPGAGFSFPKREAWMTAHPTAEWDDYDDAKLEARDTWREMRQADQSRTQQHFSRIADARAKYPDWDTVVLARTDLRLSSALERAIQDSPQGGDIVYWLGSHPDQCAQLAAESQGDDPVVAARWMRKYLETQVAASPAAARPDSAVLARPSQAKPPVNRVGGSAAITPADPEDLEFGPEYIRRENAREKKEKEARRW